MFSKVDINGIIRSAMVIARAFVKKATDNFSVQLEDNIPRINGSAQGLEQVVLNLLQNACQALCDRGKAVSIGTSYLDAGRGRVMITVRDEGAGMSDEVLAQIKQPFFTTKREQGGTGLGLSISAGIVDEHGGTLTIESQPGTGTVVTVAFPPGELD